MAEMWQLYDDQGRALAGQGGKPDDIFEQKMLHGASHVWIWQKVSTSVEVLLQKRASTKRTWPDRYDISAAGHIDVGEEPLTAALRETQEEIGVGAGESDLSLVGVHRAYLTTPEGVVENEFQWLYVLKLSKPLNFNLQTREVASLEWKRLESFSLETSQYNSRYVPHGKIYYQTVISAIEAAAT